MQLFTTSNPVAYRYMERADYCGAATAQMILDSVVMAVPGQAELHTYASTQSSLSGSGWVVSPDALAQTLNTFRVQPGGAQPGGVPPTKEYSALVGAAEPSASRRIADALIDANLRAASAVPIDQNDHWIVVCGVTTEEDELPLDGSYTINSFWIHNPVPIPTDPQNLPFVQAEQVSYLLRWSNPATPRFFGRVNAANVEEFVTVCDPEKGDDAIDPTPQIQGPSGPPEEGELIDPDQARDAAAQGIERHQLRLNEWFDKALGDPNSRLVEPLLVYRLPLHLDNQGLLALIRGGELSTLPAYYIVPWARQEDGSESSARFAVGGRSGNFWGGQAFDGPAKYLFAEPVKSLRVGLVKSLFARLVRSLFAGRKPVLNRVIEDSGAPTPLVWKPCRESHTLYHPFRVLLDGDLIRYIGYDGTPYDELHRTGLG